MARNTMTTMPSELTEISLVYAHPRDVASFSRTCRAFHALVYSSADSHLWRLMWFAQGYDDPRIGENGILPERPWSWKKELQRRVRAEILAGRGFANAPIHDRLDVLRTVVLALTTLPTLLESTVKSGTEQWVTKVVRDAGICNRPTANMGVGGDLSTVYYAIQKREDRDSLEERQLRHRIHVHLGLSEYEKSAGVRAERRAEARCFVYDLRNYSEKNHWGPTMPYQPSGVNWVHADHLLEVITHNLDDHGPEWQSSRAIMGFDNVRPYSAPGTKSRKPRDWAGLEGKWRRIVCFMDYRDVYEYNFAQGGPTGPRDRSVFRQPDFEEAIRFVYLELYMTGFSPTFSSNPLPLKPADAKNIDDLGPRPTIHFEGTSKGGAGNEATVKGLVRMMKNNTIRWSFISIFNEQLQWSSEGVQLGSVGSAMGIVGTWTGANHETSDPAGPFWLWKTGHLDHCHKCGQRI